SATALCVSAPCQLPAERSHSCLPRVAKRTESLHRRKKSARWHLGAGRTQPNTSCPLSHRPPVAPRDSRGSRIPPGCASNRRERRHPRKRPPATVALVQGAQLRPGTSRASKAPPFCVLG